MGVGVFKEVYSKASKEEFVEVLKIATQDIKFNNINFKKLTKEEDLKILLERSLTLVRSVQAYEGIN